MVHNRDFGWRQAAVSADRFHLASIILAVCASILGVAGVKRNASSLQEHIIYNIILVVGILETIAWVLLVA
jgi:hypothetical protein